MQLEQIRDKAYSDAIRKVPNPSFGASIHEYGETEQEVLKSIDDRFRDEVFIRSMELLHEKRPKYRYESPEGYYFELTEAFKSAGASILIFRDDPLEHNCGCSIHICGKDRFQLMVYDYSYQS